MKPTPETHNPVPKQPGAERFATMNQLFNPRSIAVVGVPRGLKSGKLFLLALLDMGYPGRIYPVHPEAPEIEGLKAYPSVSAIPGQVDLAIVLVPQEQTLGVVRECAEKGVKGVVLFTAGYKETGTPQGRAMEEELVRLARRSGMRLIGPNCMGLYAPRTGLSFFPEISRVPGPVGLISHSGSLANILARVGAEKGIYFSKAVSVGNECDLWSADFLEYLGQDPETKVIGMYLEGIKDGPRFLEVLQEASLRKPVVIWKVGLTPEGSRAALSHTGALTGSAVLWEGLVRQGGAVPVSGYEPWVDTLMACALLPDSGGDRVAVISGPGGLAVSAAEACVPAGLRLAELSPSTRKTLGEFVPPTGTSLGNPIDVGLTASFRTEIYARAVDAAAADPGVDALFVIGRGLDPRTNRSYVDGMIRVRKDYEKPLMMINIPGAPAESAQHFFEAGIPFFETPDRAMKAYARIQRYRAWRLERCS